MRIKSAKLAGSATHFALAIFILIVLNSIQSPAGLQLSFLISTCLIFGTLRLGVRGFSLAFHFTVSFIALFYFLPLVTVFTGSAFEPDRSSDFVFFVSSLHIAAIHLFLGAYLLFGSNGSGQSTELLDIRKTRLISMLGLAVFALTSVMMFVSAGGAQAIEASRTDLKAEQGVPAFLLWLYYISSTSLFFYVLWLRGGDLLIPARKRIFHWIIFLSVVIGAVTLAFIALRSRSPVIMTAFCIYAALVSARFVSFSDGSITRQSKISHSRIMLVLVGIGALAIFLRFFRGVFFEGAGTLSDLSLTEMIYGTLKGGDLGYITMVMDILDWAQQQGLSLNGDSYVRLVWLVFPDSLLGNRPLDTQVLIGRALSGVDVMTIPPGVVGDAYLNFGIAGLSLFLIYGSICGLLERTTSTLVMAGLFATSVFTVFHFVRGAFGNTVVVFVLLYFTLYLCARFMRRPRDSMGAPDRD